MYYIYKEYVTNADIVQGKTHTQAYFGRVSKHRINVHYQHRTAARVKSAQRLI